MVGFDRGRRRIFILLSVLGGLVLFFNVTLLTGTDVKSKVEHLPIHVPLTKEKPGSEVKPVDHGVPKTEPWNQGNDKFEDNADIDDHHPIAGYMKKADEALRVYEDGISRTFKETVDKYRRKYRRHPPPGFRDWYKFARERTVHNIDDFEQVMDDIRPFWGMEPSLIRSYAANLGSTQDTGISTLHIRDKKVWKTTFPDWRMDTFQKLVGTFVQYLPDMDICMNRHDQPRIVVPWDDMQALLKKEAESRHLAVGSEASWTTNMTGFWKEDDSAPVPDFKFTHLAGKQYMLTAKEACPPESPARNNQSSSASTDARYKDPRGGFVTNFNTSSDLCVIGPEIQDKHGLMFAATTLQTSSLLLPIFGECKVNVNSDILFPANMYYGTDDRYVYDPKNDYEWDDKHDIMSWRGAASGGTNTAENWSKIHRARLNLATNSTLLGDKQVLIMKQDPERPGNYENFEKYKPKEFAQEHTDVGFTDGANCMPMPNCTAFFDNVWTYKKKIPQTEQFQSKFLIDVDGASFSGRWRAFVQSKSLGIKATIFREWHDSRLIPWRHFVPLDNRYDELYAILTYFIGLGKEPLVHYSGDPYVQRHDFEGRKIGRQGREWASKVLRTEDMEIYMFRLLIEYARVIDDNRDRIGYSDDGTELDKYDPKLDDSDTKAPTKDSNGAHG